MIYFIPIAATVLSAKELCRIANAEDMAKIKVERIVDDIEEAGRLPRSPTNTKNKFEIRITRRVPGNSCIRIFWRTVAIGRYPADPHDFLLQAMPHGEVVLPAWPSGNKLNPPMVAVKFTPWDDGKVETNETLAFEIIDARSRVIWGAERWKPDTTHSSVIWNNDDHRNGMVLTIHDFPRTCPQRGRGRRFEIHDWQDNPIDAKYASWPAITILRPTNEPIIQCEDVSWTLAAGGRRSLRASDFRAGHFPSGTLRFSSDSSGSEYQEDSMLVPLAVKSPKKLHGRTATIILRSRQEIVAQKVVVLP